VQTLCVQFNNSGRDEIVTPDEMLHKRVRDAAQAHKLHFNMSVQFTNSGRDEIVTPEVVTIVSICFQSTLYER
jgi:hypothetical protein